MLDDSSCSTTTSSQQEERVVPGASKILKELRQAEREAREAGINVPETGSGVGKV
jgi:hypothetical protein